MRLPFHSWAMLFCSFVLPLRLDGFTGCSCVLMNSLFSLFRVPMICDISVKGPTFSPQFQVLVFPFRPKHLRILWLSSVWTYAENFPTGKEGLFQRKGKIHPQRQKTLEGYIRKMEILGWFTARMDTLLGGLPHRQQCPKYLRHSLDSSNSYWLWAKPTAGLHLFCQLSQSAASCHCQGTTGHHAHLLKVLSTVYGTSPSGLYQKQMGHTADPLTAFCPMPSCLDATTLCHVCKNSLPVADASCSQESFLRKCLVLSVGRLQVKFRMKETVCMEKMSTPNLGGKINLLTWELCVGTEGVRESKPESKLLQTPSIKRSSTNSMFFPFHFFLSIQH